MRVLVYAGPRLPPKRLRAATGTLLRLTMRPARLLILLLLALGPALAGCMGYSGVVERVEVTRADPTWAAAPRVDLYETSLLMVLPEGASSAAARLSVTQEDWQRGSSTSTYPLLRLAYDAEGVADDAFFILAVYWVDGDTLRLGRILAFLGEDSGTLTLFGSDPKDVDFLIVAATDDPAGALRVRVGLVEDSNDGLPGGEVEAPLVLTGHGTRASYYYESFVGTSSLLAPYRMTHDVEVQDNRGPALGGLSGAAMLQISAVHEPLRPALHYAFASHQASEAHGSWRFSDATGETPITRRGTYVYALSGRMPTFAAPRGMVTALADGLAETSFTLWPNAETFPRTSFFATTLPLDIGDLGFTMETEDWSEGTGSFQIGLDAPGARLELGGPAP